MLVHRSSQRPHQVPKAKVESEVAALRDGLCTVDLATSPANFCGRRLSQAAGVTLKHFTRVRRREESGS